MTNFDSSPDYPPLPDYSSPDSYSPADASPIPHAITGQELPDTADTYMQPDTMSGITTPPSSVIGEHPPQAGLGAGGYAVRAASNGEGDSDGEKPGPPLGPCVDVPAQASPAKLEGFDVDTDKIDELKETDPGRPVIEMATMDTIDRYIPNPLPKMVRPNENVYANGEFLGQGEPTIEHPLKQWSAATSPEHPAIIYDDGAAFCSPMIAFDETGNALHVHATPLSSRVGYTELDETYFPNVANFVGEGKVGFAVGGSNTEHSEEYTLPSVTNPVDAMLNNVEARVRQTYPDADFYSLVSKRAPNQQRAEPLIPDGIEVRGFIFVPRYIASDDRNHLLVIAEEERARLRAYLDIPPYGN